MKALYISFLLIAVLFQVSLCHRDNSLQFTPAWPAINLPFVVDLDYLNGYVYATSITGQVNKFADSDSLTNTASVFFDISLSTTPGVTFFNGFYYGSEDGLASFAFHPNYPTVPKFYTFYSASETTIQVTAWTVSSGAVNYASGDILLSIAKVAASEARLGGDLQFDQQGRLYISVGDGANPTQAQNINSLLGKVLRIRPSITGTGYTIPSGNPFKGSVLGADEIYSRGYRNPRKITFPFSFDETSDDHDSDDDDDDSGNQLFKKIFVGDVGDVYDEIHDAKAGSDDGWNVYDGCTCVATSGCNNPKFEFPFFTTTSTDAHTLTLGPYYPKSNNPASFEQLESRVLFADLYSGWLYYIRRKDLRDCNTVAVPVAQANAHISSILRIGTNVYVADVFSALYESPAFYKLVEADN